MNRIQIINGLIQKNGYSRYLEIGVNTPLQPGYSHEEIRVATKHGVDPNVDTTYRMPSDDFFAQNTEMYDIVFVDGLHIFEQAHRDIENALRFLNPGGTIVVHDTHPVREITQRRERASSVWHGDVWKAILKLRMERSDISIYTVDTDEGCTIIEKGRQELHVPAANTGDIYDYVYYRKHTQEILHLVSAAEFAKRFNLPASPWYEGIRTWMRPRLQRLVQLLKKV